MLHTVTLGYQFAPSSIQAKKNVSEIYVGDLNVSEELDISHKSGARKDIKITVRNLQKNRLLISKVRENFSEIVTYCITKKTMFMSIGKVLDEVTKQARKLSLTIALVWASFTLGLYIACWLHNL